MDITAKVLSYHGEGIHLVEKFASQNPGVYYPTGELLTVKSQTELTIGALYDMRISEQPAPIDYKLFGVIFRNL